MRMGGGQRSGLRARSDALAMAPRVRAPASGSPSDLTLDSYVVRPHVGGTPLADCAGARRRKTPENK